MKRYLQLRDSLKERSHKWLVTGGAGFIGSHLVENLLQLDQEVVALDDFSTGKPENLDSVKDAVADEQWRNFRIIEGSITDPDACREACRDVEFVLHHAARGSVPQSIEDPLASHQINVTGTLNMLIAARDASSVRRFIYASSTAVYGDDKRLPKLEKDIGSPLSPYAATKRIDEIYAGVFARVYGLETVGLRYFNIYGPRQDPEGPYAAVIPRWISAMQLGETIQIHGTGETSRDFCYVADAVQANLLAATTENESALGEIFNIALHRQTSLNELFAMIRDAFLARDPSLAIAEPAHGEFRRGDVVHSLADIKKAKNILGFQPGYSVAEGLEATINWFQDARAVSA